MVDPAVAIGIDGRTIIAFKGDGGLTVLHCKDAGCIGDVASVNNLALDANGSLTIGADGLPVITFYYDGHLYFARCNDPACSGQDETFTDLGNGGQYSSITIGVDGLPIISHYDATAGALKVAHCANVFCTPYFRRR